MSVDANAAAIGQVSASAAEIYDEFFVPALFGEWAEPLCHAAGLKPGDVVLDVACGTGATTRAAKAIVGSDGSATGLDRNDDMLSVARSRTSEIVWVKGRAESLPFSDRAFSALLCQFGLMFFEDRAAALREMNRVVHPLGTIALSVWDEADSSPGYARMIALIHRLFGADTADALRAPFILGDRTVLHAALAAGGVEDASIDTRTGTARFPSISDWVRTDVRGWTLSDMIDDDQFAALSAAAEREFDEFVGSDGSVSFPAPAHIVTWSAPRQP